MHNVKFIKYLRDLHQLGEIDIAMKESKTFIDFSQESSNDANNQLAHLPNDLLHLQSRQARLEKSKREGILDRRDVIKEENEIGLAYLKWLDEFGAAKIQDFPYEEFGQDLPDGLREKLFPLPDDPEEPASTFNKKAWIIGGLMFAVLSVGVYFSTKSNEKSEIVTDAPKLDTCFVKSVNGYLYAEPKLFSEQLMKVPNNIEYPVQEIKIYRLGNENHYFFKVSVNDRNGWLSNYEVGGSSLCLPMIRRMEDSLNLQTDTPTTSPEKEECFVITTGIRLLESPNPSSESLTTIANIHEYVYGRIFKVLKQEKYIRGDQRITYYKIKDNVTGYTGWVEHEECTFVSPTCRR